ncbi:MAG: hypothetical protein ACI4R9_09425 [Kiritimatiellia bacterium]
MNDSKIPNVEPGIPEEGAVSVYGQADAMGDFPVLKAFQQYIDAEQAKAQKRMTTLCVFFAIILTIVVGVFVALLIAMSTSRNDTNDKLIQYMLQERERQHAALQAPSANPQNEAAFKVLTDTVSALQKQLADQQLKLIEEKQKAAEEAVRKAAEAAAAQVKAKQQPIAPPSSEQLELEKKNKAERARITKEKEELAKEKERLRQQEIELHRRRLYPDYYRKLDAEKNSPRKSVPVTREAYTYLADDDEDGADEDLRDNPLPAKPVPAAVQKKPDGVKPIRRADGSLRYFEDDEEEDETTPPADKAPTRDAQPTDHASSGWSIPLD